MGIDLITLNGDGKIPGLIKVPEYVTKHHNKKSITTPTKPMILLSLCEISPLNCKNLINIFI